MSTYKFGLRSESLACLLLILKGYKIIARRYKTPVGEIDIVAKKFSIIAFVEVKARKDISSLEVLTTNQQRRIINAAKYFISSNKIYVKNYRFDLIIIKDILSSKHIKNAFSE